MALKSQQVFDTMAKAIAANPAIVEKIKGVYQFTITANGKDHVVTVDAKNKGGQGVKVGKADAPDCTIKMADEDFFDMATGKLDAMTAFGQGKIKIGGNMMLAQKLSVLTEAAAKL